MLALRCHYKQKNTVHPFMCLSLGTLFADRKQLLRAMHGLPDLTISVLGGLHQVGTHSRHDMQLRSSASSIVRA